MSTQSSVPPTAAPAQRCRPRSGKFGHDMTAHLPTEPPKPTSCSTGSTRSSARPCCTRVRRCSSSPGPGRARPPCSPAGSPTCWPPATSASGQVLAITFTNKAAAEMRERVVAAGRAAGPGDVGVDVPLHVRADPAQPGVAAAGPELELLDLRRRRLAAAAADDRQGHGAGHQAVLAAAAGQRHLQPQERADRSRAGRRRGVRGRRGPGPHHRRGLRRVPAPAARGQRAGLRRPDRRDSRCAASAFRRSPSTTGGGSGTSWSTSTRTPTTRSTCWCANWSARDRADDDVPPAELCVVGDADQSIYAFRGATIRNIEDFERDYPNATTILLEQNYRSTQNILTAANSVISRNAGRREKRLWTDAGDGELIVGYVADNEHDEAAVRRRGDRRARRPRRHHLQRRRGVLPHQQLVARAGRGLHPRRHPVQSRWRRSLLRAQGDPRHRRLPAGAGQPRRLGQHAAHPQHPAARHRRPRRGVRRGVRREHRRQLQRRAAGRRRGQGADAEHPLGEGDRRLRRDARRSARASRRRARRAGRGGARPHRLPRRAGVVQRPTGSGAAGQPQRIGQRRTRIQHRPGQRRGAAARTTPSRRRGHPRHRRAGAVPGAGVAGGRRRRAFPSTAPAWSR